MHPHIYLFRRIHLSVHTLQWLRYTVSKERSPVYHMSVVSAEEVDVFLHESRRKVNQPGEGENPH